MRFNLTLNCAPPENILPLNYQYELSAWIYKTIHQGNPDFAIWLHNQGYLTKQKRFKLFTFSNLQLSKFKVSNDRLELLNNEAKLLVSFYPIEAIEPFITGLFRNQEFFLGDKISKVHFTVRTVEKAKEPVFSQEMTFHLLSPVHIIQRNQYHSGRVDHLSPEHKDFEHLLFSNLIEKYHIFNKKNINFVIQDYKLEILTKPKSRLVKIKANTPEETFLKGFLFDFKITAPQELIKIGYYAGFGKSNALGFGCSEVRQD